MNVEKLRKIIKEDNKKLEGLIPSMDKLENAMCIIIIRQQQEPDGIKTYISEIGEVSWNAIFRSILKVMMKHGIAYVAEVPRQIWHVTIKDLGVD